MRILIRFGAAALVAAGITQFASAQVITNENYDRGLRYGNITAPFDGAPYNARYNYSLGNANFYFNGSARNMYYLDYLDRVDRAAKFGYPMPVDPLFGGPPIPHPDPTVTPPRTFIGGLIQSLRRQ